MFCRICHLPEKKTSEDSIYVCSKCISIIGLMAPSKKNELVDKLYLAGRTEDAQFVEKIIRGVVTTTSEVPQLKRRTFTLTKRRRI